jgi:hypothetical protein
MCLSQTSVVNFILHANNTYSGALVTNIRHTPAH